MELEEFKVLTRHRWALWESWKDKEWWYTEVHDEDSGLYVGFGVTRVALLDSVHVLVFEPGSAKPRHWDWKGFLKPGKPDSLHLEAHGWGLEFLSDGAAETGWTHRIRAAGLEVELRSKPTLPPFTKFDDTLRLEYGLLSFFGNAVEGTVLVDGRRYGMRRGLGYADHCFGRVPRRTAWHWIAVQNEGTALNALVNYGVDGQKYCQAWDAEGGRWVRLDQDVSFECDFTGRWSHPWKVTSPDLELSLEVEGHEWRKERIPPLVPFLIRLDHHECRVKAQGQVRIDGRWRETGPMHGVLEQHGGRW